MLPYLLWRLPQIAASFSRNMLEFRYDSCNHLTITCAMSKNFAGQNLDGLSFREQDLRDADFSGCQLKSCDFTNADLTGAKFCRAMLGVDGRRKLVKWAVAFVFGMVGGMLVWSLNYMLASAFNEIYKNLIWTDRAEENDTLLLLCSLYAVSVCLSLFAVLKYRDWRIVTGYFLWL